MEEFCLENRVQIVGATKSSQLVGKIIEKRRKRVGVTSYLVRYFDANDRVCEAWFEADDLKAVS